MTAKMTDRPHCRHCGHRHHTRGAHGGGVPCIASRRQRGERQGHPEGSRAAARWLAGVMRADYMLSSAEKEKNI